MAEVIFIYLEKERWFTKTFLLVKTMKNAGLKFLDCKG